MREILYSPGFGAGWTTWNRGEVAKIMLTYAPIVEFINGGGKFTDKECHAKLENTHPLLRQLIEDVRKATGNPEEYVCVLGAEDLRVARISGRVLVEDYDGNESYREEGDTEGYI